MPDNISISTEEIGGNHVQIVKPSFGAAGVATVVSAADPLPVTVATTRELGTNDALNVAICDGSGNQITSFGGGTQYTEGDTDATPAGTVAMFKDTGNAINAVSAANPLPVEPGSGVAFPVTDNSGSLTVDNAGTFAVQSAQSGAWTVQPGNTANTTPWLASIHDGTTKATVRDLGSNDALNVSICDGSGNQITSFGGGTQYTEGDTDATPTGTVVMFRDSGDAINSVSAANPLPVEPGTGAVFPVSDNSGSLTVDNAGTFAVQAAQTGTWTVQPGNTANTTAWLVTGTGGTFPVTDSGGSLTVDNAGTFAVQAAQSGTWTVQPGNTANTTAWLVTGTGGTFPVTDSGGSLTVDNAGTFAVQVDGAALTALQLIDNAVATDGAAAVTGLFQVGGTDGTNAQILSTNASGHLNIADGGNSITVDGTVAATQSGTWTVTGAGGTFPVTDSGGSLTVDNAGTFATQATQAGTWTVQPGNTANTTPWLTTIHDGSNAATVRNLASNDALNVAIVDGSGNHVTSFGGGTQYTAGTGALSVTGTAVMWRDGSDTMQVASPAEPLPVKPGTGIAFPVTDNSGSLTVDNAGTFAVQAAQSGAWTVQPGNTANTTPWLASIHDGTTKATVRELGTNDALNVAICDGSGNQLTSFYNTEYTEGDNDATPIGTVAMFKDAADAINAVSAATPLPVEPGTGVAFPVTDNGGSLTVDNAGTFAVQAARSLSTSDAGLTTFTLVSGASNNATSVATGARRLHWISAFNLSASNRFLKFYDKSSAPAPASDTPILTIPIPPLGGYNTPLPAPIALANGLAYAIVAGVATNDNTSISANDVVVNGGYV